MTKLKKKIREEKDPLIKGLKVQSHVLHKRLNVVQALLDGTTTHLRWLQGECTRLIIEKKELRALFPDVDRWCKGKDVKRLQ